LTQPFRSKHFMRIKKIISGGQTGADRAALDFAIKNRIPHGGSVPKGRMAEDGPLSKRYKLRETQTADYNERTEKNVIDSDGTLLLGSGALNGGSALTMTLARSHGRPCLHVDAAQVSAQQAAAQIERWIQENRISVLNVAGPRASKSPDIYVQVMKIFQALLQGV